jgi:hypothetical protein
MKTTDIHYDAQRCIWKLPIGEGEYVCVGEDLVADVANHKNLSDTILAVYSVDFPLWLLGFIADAKPSKSRTIRIPIPLPARFDFSHDSIELGYN